MTTSKTRGRRRKSAQQRTLDILLNVIMIAMVLYCLVPLAWLIFSSTKSAQDLFTSPGLWFANEIVFFQNVADTFAYDGGVFTRWVFNTIFYAVVAGGGAAIIATLGGYALAKMRFPGRSIVMVATLAVISVPATVITVPTFLLFSNLGIVNTPLAVILPQLSNPFGLFLMMVFARSAVPDSLMEAAELDGAGPLRTFWSVCAPLLAPGFVTVLLFSLVGVWNNYFLPLIMLRDANDYPLTVGLTIWLRQAENATVLQVPHNLILTGSLLAIIPLLVSFFFLQRYWQSGLSAGAVKQ